MKRTQNKQSEEESVKVDLRRKTNFSDQCGCLVLIRSPID